MSDEFLPRRDPPTAIARRGLLLVLSSPSGAGKSSIARRLLDDEEGLTLSVSVTTRSPRPSEEDGRDYYFVDEPRFVRMLMDGELLEHATVFGNRYGTPRAPVAARLGQGQDLLCDIDWQGARQLRQHLAEDLVSVFILPPSQAELARRLRARRQDSEAIVEARMARATAEIGHWVEYDYVIINRDLDRAVMEVRAILTAERLRRSRQIGLAAVVSALMQS